MQKRKKKNHCILALICSHCYLLSFTIYDAVGKLFLSLLAVQEVSGVTHPKFLGQTKYSFFPFQTNIHRLILFTAHSMERVKAFPTLNSNTQLNAWEAYPDINMMAWQVLKLWAW